MKSNFCTFYDHTDCLEHKLAKCMLPVRDKMAQLTYYLSIVM